MVIGRNRISIEFIFELLAYGDQVVELYPQLTISDVQKAIATGSRVSLTYARCAIVAGDNDLLFSEPEALAEITQKIG